MFFQISSIFKKLDRVDSEIQKALVSPEKIVVPYIPARDIEYKPISYLSGRLGISTVEGKQKLLHDLANIELQAMELGLRTLVEFPWAPEAFKQELVEIIKQEAKHLEHCLNGMEKFGGYWGKWPIHLGLWHSTHAKDSLLERIFIVHRYLEGSGLDAGDTLLRRLSGAPDKLVGQIVNIIVEEEVGHVEFGSRWYKHYCNELKINDELFFKRMCLKLLKKHPRRDKMSYPLRKKALFNSFELDYLEKLRGLVV